MTDPHSRSFWPTPGGGLVCACGKSRRPLSEPIEQPKESTMTTKPKQELTEAEKVAKIAAFGFDQPPGEHCGRGVCAANEGHEGTCAQASGWDEVDE